MTKRKIEEIRRINQDRLMTIENLKLSVQYDIPKEYVAEFGNTFNIKSITEELLKTDDRGKYLKELGARVADKLFELEAKYRDRTGEVINFVAEKTGIYFPHVFQKYIEYFYIGTRPQDRYNVTMSTVREIKVNTPECSFKKILIENGMGDRFCAEFCKAVFDRIIKKIKINVRFSIKQEPGVEYCEHQFYAGSE